MDKTTRHHENCRKARMPKSLRKFVHSNAAKSLSTLEEIHVLEMVYFKMTKDATRLPYYKHCKAMGELIGKARNHLSRAIRKRDGLETESGTPLFVEGCIHEMEYMIAEQINSKDNCQPLFNTRNVQFLHKCSAEFNNNKSYLAEAQVDYRKPQENAKNVKNHMRPYI